MLITEIKVTLLLLKRKQEIVNVTSLYSTLIQSSVRFNFTVCIFVNIRYTSLKDSL